MGALGSHRHPSTTILFVVLPVDQSINLLRIISPPLASANSNILAGSGFVFVVSMVNPPELLVS